MPGSFKQASILTKTFASLSAAAALGGCSTLHVASGISSPLGSDEQQNAQLCMDFNAAQARAAAIPVGTPKTEVYADFGIRGDDTLKRLSKEDINRALYGQSTLNVTFDQRGEAQSFLNSLEGRSLTCQSVHSRRSFGITHSEVDRSGYQYTLTFVFKDDRLFDPVAIAGEPVKERQNHGYLSDFSPASALRAVRPF